MDWLIWLLIALGVLVYMTTPFVFSPQWGAVLLFGIAVYLLVLSDGSVIALAFGGVYVAAALTCLLLPPAVRMAIISFIPMFPVLIYHAIWSRLRSERQKP